MPKANSGTVATKATKAESLQKDEDKVMAVRAKRAKKYTDIRVCGVLIPREKLLCTVEYAKELLGWYSEDDYKRDQTAGLLPDEQAKVNVEFGDDYDIRDMTGKKIRLLNNTHNRPFMVDHAEAIAQDILNNHWKFNGEAGIIGETGLSLSFQHRGLGLIFAEQKRLMDDDEGKHWRRLHPKPLTIQMLIVTGISEDPATTRTIDNIRERTLADALFADSAVLGQWPKEDKVRLAKMAENAIKLIWDRTGVKNDPYSAYRTHSESIQFYTSHKKVVECVKHIFLKNQSSQVQKWLAPGSAAGLMYLMATAKSDREKWIGDKNATERNLDVSLMDDAKEFWNGLVDEDNAKFKGVRDAIKLLENKDTGDVASPAKKMAVIVLAWNRYRDKATMTRKDCWPDFEKNPNTGLKQLKFMPEIGGIDLGNAKKALKELALANAANKVEAFEDDDVEAPPKVQPEPSPAVQAAHQKRVEAVKAASLAKKAADTAPPKAAPLKGGTNR